MGFHTNPPPLLSPRAPDTAFINHKASLSSESSGAPGDWYLFDDSKVSRLSDASQVVSPSAYIMIFQKRGGV